MRAASLWLIMQCIFGLLANCRLALALICLYITINRESSAFLLQPHLPHLPRPQPSNRLHTSDCSHLRRLLLSCLSLDLFSISGSSSRAQNCDNICPEKYLHFTQSCLASSFPPCLPAVPPCGRQLGAWPLLSMQSQFSTFYEIVSASKFFFAYLFDYSCCCFYSFSFA